MVNWELNEELVNARSILHNPLFLNQKKTLLYNACKVHFHLPHNIRSYWELFWYVFSRIRTKYREILRISPYALQMRKNTGQNNPKYAYFSRSDIKEDHFLASGSIFLLETFCVIFLSMKFIFHYRHLVTLIHCIFLSHFMPLVSFYTLWKHQKTSGETFKNVSRRLTSTIPITIFIIRILVY